jgi:hypothetical protein
MNSSRLILSRFSFRLSLFTQTILVLIALALLIVMQTARAQDSSDETTSTTTTTTSTTTTTTAKKKAAKSVALPPAHESVNETTPVSSSDPASGAGSGETRDFIVSAKFGSTAATGLTGCKTEALLKESIKELKADCNAWLKDRKAELKNKFHTGTCQEQCSDCGMGLQRCTVTGEVHYSK